MTQLGSTSRTKLWQKNHTEPKLALLRQKNQNAADPARPERG